MSLLIDGYNLLHATGIIGSGRGPGALQRSRTALLNFIVESLSETDLGKCTVVFDASNAPYGVQRNTKHRGLAVLFADKDADADSLIEDLIIAHSAPKRLTVVSSDHRIQRAASRRKATPVDSDVWFRQILQARSDAGKKNDDGPVIKPEGPFSQGEIDFWLKTFGFDEKS